MTDQQEESSWKGDPGWIETVSGETVNLIDPDTGSINILDIAHGLAFTCRFNGQCDRYYSVAEHSVLMAANAENKLDALLHDATEAYVPDVSRPLKPFLSEFMEIEEGLHEVIAERFDLSWPPPDEIKELDTSILLKEAKELMPSGGVTWNGKWGLGDKEPLDQEIFNWSPEQAKQVFLDFYVWEVNRD